MGNYTVADPPSTKLPHFIVRMVPFRKDVFVPKFSIYPAGLLSLAVGHPFDTIKVRLQTMRPTDCLVTGGSLQVKDSNIIKC